MAHAELKDARERALIGQAGNQRLADAELVISVHGAHEPMNETGAHQAVGVEQNEIVELAAVASQELPDIARLVVGVGVTAAIVSTRRVGHLGAPVGEMALLLRGNRGISRVAQNE